MTWQRILRYSLASSDFVSGIGPATDDLLLFPVSLKYEPMVCQMS